MSDNGWLLSQDLLDSFHQRASRYDAENTFFHEDFEDLKSAGYLLMAIPEAMGGLGMNLAQIGRETRRLAYYAPATALATNMHHYWMGTALSVHQTGDDSCDWMLEAGANGEVFAAGHAEKGNDLPVLVSTTQAERADGGYRFTGQKGFGSLTPVWTFLGIHGMDMSDPEAPKVVHGFMPRDTEGYEIKDTWDVMGMRATRSDDTVLNGAFVPDKYIPRIVAPGAAGMDMFVLGIFAWALINFGNVYCGIAKRALDLTLDSVKASSAVGLTRSRAYNPEIQHRVADMVMELESIEPQLDKVAEDWSNGVDYGAGWVIKIVSAKHRAVTGAYKVVDTAMDISGGFGMFKKSELERLFRDCRAGRFHPANPMLTHELVAKLSLGIDPDEQPRWG